MELSLVVAVVPCFALQKTEEKLRQIGVRGVTVSMVKGYGEYANTYTRDWLTDELKIEVFAARDKVRRVVDAIVAAAHTGSPGDGIVAVLPVDDLVSIRSRSEAIPDTHVA